MEVIAIVPARAGSKGYPDKNIKEISGKTLLQHAVSAGVTARSVSEVYVSTDSEDYACNAMSAGAKSLELRPAFLSGDHATTVDVVLHFLEQIDAKSDDLVVLLQPTSPIRKEGLVDEAVRMAMHAGESVVTVAKVEDPHPYKMKVIDEGCLRPFLADASSEVPRQSLPPVFELTGAVYVTRCDSLRERRSFFSPNTQALVTDQFVNIDTELDFLFLSFLVEKGLVDF